MMRPIILGLILAFGLSAQISQDSTTVNLGDSCGGSNGTQAVGAQGFVGDCTWTHVVNPGNNRALFVGIVGTNSDTTGGGAPTSIVMDGVEPLALVSASATSAYFTQVWEFVNPPIGTHTLVAVWPKFIHTYSSIYIASISLFGVNQDNPTPVLPSIDLSTANLTTTATLSTSVAGDFLIGVAVSDGNRASSMTAATGQTEIITGSAGRQNVSSPVIGSIAYKANVGAGLNTLAWTSSPPAPAGITLVAVKPAGDIIRSPVGEYSYPSQTRTIPRPYVTSGQDIASPSGGDTQYCTWVGAGTKSGEFGGGSIICQYNDGVGGLGCSPNGGNSICIYQLANYDKTNIANTTFAGINNMTSYGPFAASSCYDGVHQMKSRKPFSLPGLVFLPIFCMNGPSPSVGVPFGSYQSGIIVSPDAGVHWCNYKSFRAGGSTCTSANWQANGDNPIDATGFQWPLADGTSKMTRLSLVDFLCQDNTVNCPVAARVDPSYLYFITEFTDGATTYLMRIHKSLGMQIMDPSNWEAYDRGSWTSTVQNASDIGSCTRGPGCSGTPYYLKDFGTFAVWEHESSFATAPMPWGPWTARPDITSPFIGFPAPVAGLCPKYDVSGRVTCTVFVSPNSNLHIYEEDLGRRPTLRR
jgi:hypothetical protein